MFPTEKFRGLSFRGGPRGRRVSPLQTKSLADYPNIIYIYIYIHTYIEREREREIYNAIASLQPHAGALSPMVPHLRQRHQESPRGQVSLV